MASAFVNNVTLPPESAYGWLSPGISFSPKHDAGIDPETSSTSPAGLMDFQFRLSGPVTMLPADEIFSNGKLIPLHLAELRPSADTATVEIYSSEGIESGSFVLSPKAPRCTTRWRELLGLKRQQNPKPDQSKVPSPAAKCPSGKSFAHLLHHRHSKPSIDPSISLPLLRDSHPQATAAEAAAISSRPSLSSTSSVHEHKDLPHPSIDSNKTRNYFRAGVSRLKPNDRDGYFPARVPARGPPAQGVPVDSPRMDPSGRIIFKGLERSSSIPSSLNGWPRTRKGEMERSYSANVRVPSVLNVPICFLRGSWNSVSAFRSGHILSQLRKERERSCCSSSSAVARPAKQRLNGRGKRSAPGREAAFW